MQVYIKIDRYIQNNSELKKKKKTRKNFYVEEAPGVSRQIPSGF